MMSVSDNFLLESEWFFLQNKICLFLKHDIFIYFDHSFFMTQSWTKLGKFYGRHDHVGNRYGVSVNDHGLRLSWSQSDLFFIHDLSPGL
jgi:hypothetical protein